MKHVTRPLALAMTGSLLASGCATAHLKGEYAPNGYPNKGGDIASQTEKHTIAEGSSWPLFWGLVEVGSTGLGEKAKHKMRPDEIITDVEVRNHISLPGALLWIVSAGLVSHHDLDLRGRIATVNPPKAPERDRTSAMVPYERDRTVIIVPPGSHVAGTHEGAGAGSFRESDLFASATIDRPLSEVSSDFREAAVRNGLIPVAGVDWTGLAPAERNEYRGTLPENRLDDVADSDIRTFLVTNESLASDVRKDPKCGLFVPGIVCYEKGGRTNVMYMRLSQHLRQMESEGKIGEGKVMTREKYDEHLRYANDFERSEQKLIDDLQRKPSSGSSGTERPDSNPGK